MKKAIFAILMAVLIILPIHFIRAKFELSDFAEKNIPEKDLVELVCLTTRYNSGQFFASLNALKTELPPLLRELELMGGDVDSPDIDNLIDQGEETLTAVCAADSFEKSKQVANEMSGYAESVKNQLSFLETDIKEQIGVVKKSLENKVKERIQPFIDSRKAALQEELDTEAEQMASVSQADLEAQVASVEFTSEIDAGNYVNERVAAMKKLLESQIGARANIKEDQLKEEIEEQVEEIIGEDRAELKALGDKFAVLGDNIKKAEIDREYAGYRTEAEALRKKLIIGLIDDNIDEAKSGLEKYRAQLEKARSIDRSIKGVAEIIAEIEGDKQVLSDELDKAFASGNEAAVSLAIDNFSQKWEEHRQTMENSLKSVAVICDIAEAQMGEVKQKLDDNLEDIKQVQLKCYDSVSEECWRINSFSERFMLIKEKIVLLLSKVEEVENFCSEISEASNSETLFLILDELNILKEDLGSYSSSLEAEKQQAVLSSLEELKSRAVPILKAVEVDILDDIYEIKAWQDSCKDNKEQICAGTNGLGPEFSDLKKRTDIFVAKIGSLLKKIEDAQNEEDLASLEEEFASAREEGMVLKDDFFLFRDKQVAGGDIDSVCHVYIDRYSHMISKFARKNMELLEKFNDCSGLLTANCQKINSIKPAYDELNSRIKAFISAGQTIYNSCLVDRAGMESITTNEQIKAIISDSDALYEELDGLLKPGGGEPEAAAINQQ